MIFFSSNLVCQKFDLFFFCLEFKIKQNFFVSLFKHTMQFLSKTTVLKKLEKISFLKLNGNLKIQYIVNCLV